jgi:hypothetical protein
MLSQSKKENILDEFPDIKLSYENITYKKVYNSDYIVALPEGKKCFAWFTYYNDNPVCLIMELINNSQIVDIKIVNVCFSSELSYGTILYGISAYYLNNHFFYIQDIHSYKGKLFNKMNWGDKLIHINKMLRTDFKQVAYNKSFYVFGLPEICKNIENIEKIQYKVSAITFNSFTCVNNYLIMPYKDFMNTKERNTNTKERNTNINERNTNERKERFERNNNNKEIVFLVKSDFRDDIYHIFCLGDKPHGIINIPDCKTSIMMNSLFRNIKENKNLDTLEESDDEDEFQNEDICKFVNLDKTYKIVCKFNHRFKKWYPIKLADNHSNISTETEIKMYEQQHNKKYF